MACHFLKTGFENASPLDWRIEDDGTVQVALIYDHERESPNRAVLHWHFQVQGVPGSTVRLVLRHFENIWNGRPGSPIAAETPCVISEDGKVWRSIVGRRIAGNRLELKLVLTSGSLYVARLEPYRISDLERFLQRIRGHEAVRTEIIGHTVEGRELELVSVGRPDAPHHVLMRGRAHPWETGGNWLLEGLIESLLASEADLDTLCLHVMPMANKDGVARGGSRFNQEGVDLNRKWDAPADPELAPENRALEAWIERVAAAGRRLDLAMDLHNDNGGRLHVSRPERGAEAYLAHMARLEKALRQYTCFTEGSTDPNFRNPGSFGEGLYTRYGIPACILELNCLWLAGLDKVPLGADWRLYGRRMREALLAYVD